MRHNTSFLLALVLLALVGVQGLARGGDSCFTATPIGLGSTMGDLANLSPDGFASCGVSGASNDFWYSYTLPFDALLMVTTCGSHDLNGVDTGTDTTLSLHGNCNNLLELACNDNWPIVGTVCAGSDQGLPRDAVVRQSLLSGETVFIRVSHFGGTMPGEFVVNLSLETAPVTNLACSSPGSSGVINAAWNLAGNYDEILVYVDGNLEASLPGTAISYSTQPLIGGSHLVAVEAIDNSIGSAEPAFCTVNVQPPPVNALGCTLDDVTGVATLNWINPVTYDEIRIYLNGGLFETILGSQTTYSTPALPAIGLTTICVEGFDFNVGPSATECCIVFANTAPIDNLICSNPVGTGDINVTWTTGGNYTLQRIYLNGTFFTDVSGTDTQIDIMSGLPPGSLAQVCVEPFTSAFGAGLQQCCTSVINPVLTPPTFTHCRNANLIANGTTITDFLGFPDSAILADVYCEVSIDTDQVQGIQPLILTSPSGTSVTLHNGGGAPDPNLYAVYSDQGIVPGPGTYNSQAVLQPAGPGTMLDFSCEQANGVWELSLTETAFGSVATLNEWCVSVVDAMAPCCDNPAAFRCDTNCQTGDVELSWTNTGSYMSIELLRNGQLLASLPGTATSYLDPTPPLGMYTYEIKPDCTPQSQQCEAIVVAPYGGETDIILALEGLTSGLVGFNDSATALEAQLLNAGLSVVQIDTTPIQNYPCLASASRIWVLTGTFPNSYLLSAAEGAHLASLASLGVDLYFESADHWGFQHVDSPLDERDGIEPDLGLNISDGDDTFDRMNGLDTGVAGLDLSNYTGVVYNQDLLGIDWNDQLAITGTTSGAPLDTEIAAAAVCWKNDPAGSTEPEYNTGVIARHNDGGLMISVTWEFGGFAGDQAQLAQQYINALSGSPQFVRGNCNDDGSTNLSDAVFLLGFLFPSPGASPNVIACNDACDTNDDGSLNLSDVVLLLDSLFGMPPAQLPVPNVCGSDPTDTDGLDCFMTGSCP